MVGRQSGNFFWHFLLKIILKKKTCFVFYRTDSEPDVEPENDDNNDHNDNNNNHNDNDNNNNTNNNTNNDYDDRLTTLDTAIQRLNGNVRMLSNLHLGADERFEVEVLNRRRGDEEMDRRMLMLMNLLFQEGVFTRDRARDSFNNYNNNNNDDNDSDDSNGEEESDRTTVGDGIDTN